LSYAPALRARDTMKHAVKGQAEVKKNTSGQQTPRRWGWGTPLKKRTATRTKEV